MKTLTCISFVSLLGLSGCAIYPTYDNLSVYSGPAPSYRVSAGYMYAPAYAPPPVYVRPAPYYSGGYYYRGHSGGGYPHHGHGGWHR